MNTVDGGEQNHRRNPWKLSRGAWREGISAMLGGVGKNSQDGEGGRGWECSILQWELTDYEKTWRCKKIGQIGKGNSEMEVIEEGGKRQEDSVPGEDLGWNSAIPLAQSCPISQPRRRPWLLRGLGSPGKALRQL